MPAASSWVSLSPSLPDASDATDTMVLARKAIFHHSVLYTRRSALFFARITTLTLPSAADATEKTSSDGLCTIPCSPVAKTPGISGTQPTPGPAALPVYKPKR